MCTETIVLCLNGSSGCGAGQDEFSSRLLNLPMILDGRLGQETGARDVGWPRSGSIQEGSMIQAGVAALRVQSEDEARAGRGRQVNAGTRTGLYGQTVVIGELCVRSRGAGRGRPDAASTRR